MDGITNGNHPPNMAKLYYQREKEFENTLKEREVGWVGAKNSNPQTNKKNNHCCHQHPSIQTRQRLGTANG